MAFDKDRADMSRLARAELSEEVELSLVPMNEIGYLEFPIGTGASTTPGSSTKKRVLGTYGLNGCTAVIIVSKAAAILAHIAPRVSFSSEPNGDANAIAKMVAVVRIEFKKAKFQPGSGLLVTPSLGARLRQRRKRISWRISSINLVSYNTHGYQVIESRKDEEPSKGKGEILIEAEDETRNVYVEETLRLQI